MNIFQLPPDLLQNIVLRTLVSEPDVVADDEQPQRRDAFPQSTHHNIGGVRGLACTICIQATFNDIDEQKAHYRSDWHRYNVKANLVRKPILSEAQFANALADLSDSISGSASSESDDASEDEDRVAGALRRAHISSATEDGDEMAGRASIPRTALRWFHSAPNTQIGIYNAVFPLKMDEKEYVTELKRMQEHPSEDGRLWTMLMIAGGHFAGMVRKRVPPLERRREKHKLPDYEVVLHKTFHRYTTRRKQGGSQSVNDNAKGPAKSAGAQLRRYGEQALRDDIRNLMAEWSEDIAASERIWIRANISNKRIFYDYEDAAFAKNDERLRTFPFPTRRPTQTELLRCLNELLHAKTTHFSEDELREQDAQALAALPKPKPAPIVNPQSTKPKPKPEVPTLTKEQETLKNLWERLLDMTRKGRLDPLIALWEKAGSSIGGVDAHVRPSQEAVVKWLLEDMGADPTTTINLDASEEVGTSTKTHNYGKTPYEVSGSKGTRDVFRRLAGVYPDKWDWLGDARVPSVLSKEMEEEQDTKKKVRRKGLKEKIKEREEKTKNSAPVEEDTEDVAPTPPGGLQVASGPQKLGGASTTSGIMGLTPEMRARLERERRARAIEARMQSTKP
ncbi:SubName: Full=Uncharacterized protein {ECO:0000313/EMBL:CCA67468.1} [Serendipita indica DSM 11827]|nr:SubName: Full=Uncharacterized protein {ECO:0000313/EMBL:CCA67468.1} [Serendipita indica DSM 11827]